MTGGECLAQKKFEKVIYFLEGYFNLSETWDNLENLARQYREREHESRVAQTLQEVLELRDMTDQSDVATYLHKNSGRGFPRERLQKFYEILIRELSVTSRQLREKRLLAETAKTPTFVYFVQEYFVPSKDYSDLEALAVEFRESEQPVDVANLLQELQDLRAKGDWDHIQRLVHKEGLRYLPPNKLKGMLDLLIRELSAE